MTATMTYVSAFFYSYNDADIDYEAVMNLKRFFKDYDADIDYEVVMNLKRFVKNQKGFIDEYVKSRRDERSLLMCTPPHSRSPRNQAMSIEEEEVPLVDGVFEGALGALALEMEALVDDMVVDRG
nr:hypothetical protein [Tanacetum cinerariifolium]